MLSLRRNFSSLLTWSVASQAAALVSVPILSRLFPPSAYGTLAVFTSVTTILVSFVTMRLEWHIPNCKTRRAIGALSLGALGICGLWMSLFVLVAWSVDLQRFLPRNGASGYEGVFIAAVCAGVFLFAVEHIATSFGVLKGDLTRLGRSRFLRQVSTALAAMLLFSFLAGDVALILASLVGMSLATAYLARGAGLLSAMAVARRSVRKVVRVLRAVSGKTLVSTMVSVVNTLSYEIVPIVLVANFSAEAAGLYFMSSRLLAKPVSLVSSSMSSSFWSFAASQYKKDPLYLYSRYLSLTGRLLLLCIPFVGIIWLFSLIAPALLGERWENISGALLAVAPLSVGNLAFSGLGHLIVLRKQHYQLAADATRLALMIAATGVAAASNLSANAAILLLACSSFIGHLVFFSAHLLAYRNLGIHQLRRMARS